MHDPVLVNTIGHAAGLLLFAVILSLLLRDRRAYTSSQGYLPVWAAALALAWNSGSLVVLASSSIQSPFAAATLQSIDFSILSILPAVLLHVILRGGHTGLVSAGYSVSAAAIALHIAEGAGQGSELHHAGLLVVTAGFSLLAMLAFASAKRTNHQSIEWVSLACLVLFVCSFPHFGYWHAGSPWTAEISWHHIGIPLVLIVILRDYRFLLLDVFVRFLMNSAMAGLYVALFLFLSKQFHIFAPLSSPRPFVWGIALVLACFSLILFADLRNRLQAGLSRFLFRRRDLNDRLRGLGMLSIGAQTEEDLLREAAAQMAAHFDCSRYAVAPLADCSGASSQPGILLPHALADASEWRWAEARVPLCLTSGSPAVVFLGPRIGHRRYLSEDMEDMRRLAGVVVEQIERFRAAELKRLATESELKALQAQMNPHFLFNALNTLYGTIDRGSQQARRLVLNLAEVLRYCLQRDRLLIPLGDELRIVQAYLEIEALRMGDRLETEIAVTDAARTVLIPMLSIQPLVENAVKHGLAAKPGAGRVRLHAETDAATGKLRVAVEDTGVGFEKSKPSAHDGMGMGLDNVRRRLTLSFGSEAALVVQSSHLGSSVSFSIPACPSQAAA